MKQDYRVNTFGLTQKQNAFVGANLPTRDCELYIADTPTDLIAISCEAMIVNAAAMEQDDADMIFGYYQEVNGCTDETILWLGEPMPPKASRKFFKCYPDFDAVADKLKYLLLTAHSRSKKSYEYSEILVNSLKNSVLDPQASRHFHINAGRADRTAAPQRTAVYCRAASHRGMDRV